MPFLLIGIIKGSESSPPGYLNLKGKAAVLWEPKLCRCVLPSSFIFILHPPETQSQNIWPPAFQTLISTTAINIEDWPRGSPRQDLFYFLKDVFFFFGRRGCGGSSLLHASFLELQYMGFPSQWLLLLLGTGSVAVAHGISCSAACGVFLDQESNQFPLTLQGGFLHWTTKEPPRQAVNFQNPVV